MPSPDLDKEFFAIVGENVSADDLMEVASNNQIQQEAYLKFWREGKAKAQADPELKSKMLAEIALETRQRIAPIIGSLGIGSEHIDFIMGIADDILWRDIERHVYQA